MDALHTRDIIHHGLRCSSVLLRHNTCVLADFGASRQYLQELALSSDTPNPDDIFRWLAPECLRIQDMETAKADIWSFGVVLFEIWTHCQQWPYDHWSFEKILVSLTIGSRLPSRGLCPSLFFEVMMACWHPLPGERPTFICLQIRLADLALLPSADRNQDMASTLPAAIMAGQERQRFCGPSGHGSRKPRFGRPA